jgi:hypothetical protein
LLDKIVATRLISAIQTGTGAYIYELSHDALIDPIYEAAERRRQEAERQKQKEEEEKQLRLKDEELRIAREKAEKERMEMEKEAERQAEILTWQKVRAIEALRAAKKQQLLAQLAVGIAFVAVLAGIFGWYKSHQARKNLENYLETAANQYYNKEQFNDAKEKYEELLNYSDRKDSILKLINQCVYNDSIKVIFYYNLNITDSLIKLENIDNYIKTDSVYKLLHNLHYKPGNEKLVSDSTTFEIKKQSFLNYEIITANSCIEAGGVLIQSARDTLVKILKLDPDNPKANELINKIRK